jgi:uncharacterized repeat protein (TIGR01451 family)
MNKILSITDQNKKWLPVILIAVGALLAFHRPLFALVSPARLELTIQHAPVIMPAVYKVYNNENAMEGKYGLFKMLVTNNSNNAAQNVEVSYQIPNYIEWKTISKIPTILPGESVVVNCYPSFPDKIVEKNTSSKESVNIKVKGSNFSDIENDFPIEIKGRNEFMYSNIPSDEIRTSAEYFDNMDLLGCYVTPEDPIIKYYTQKVQEKVLKGETASVFNDEKEGVRFLQGIYYSTLVSHMVYSGTSGVPTKIEDVSSITQSIRLPREVLVGKTGLCIELSLLYASIMTSAGMDPVIYMIPGHAYPGFRMNGRYYAIEATGIRGEGMGGSMSTDQAFQAGTKELDEFIKRANAGDDRYQIIDIREVIKKGALAMELKDDSYMRQKIDEMGAGFEPQNITASVPNNNGGGNRRPAPDPNPGNDNNSSVPSGYNLFEGIVNFVYPSSWSFKTVAPGIPAYKYNVGPNLFGIGAEVYDYSSYGYSSGVQALENMRSLYQQVNGVLQYSNAGQNDAGYAVYTGSASVGNITVSFTAAYKRTNHGLVGVLVSVPPSSPSYNSITNTIINSLK